MFWSKKTIRNLSTILMTVAILLVIGIGNAKADVIFGEAVNLGPTVNTPAADPLPSITADELELYFESYRSGGHGNADVWVTKRATIDDEWGQATNLGSTINSSGWDGWPCIFPDGLTLYFVNERAGLTVTRRATRSDNWDPPVALGPPINSIPPNDSVFTSISFDGLELYIGGHTVPRPGGFGGSDLWMSTRSAVSDAWDPPLNLGPTVNSSAHDRYPSISADGLALFFSSYRPGGHGGQDIWVAMRVTEDDDWGTPVNLGPMVNTSSSDGGPSISADGRTLYFYSNRPGGYGNHDLYQVTIEPIVDFNADGIVDAADICIMVDHWGTDESLCDIGPMPWGDGIVDVQDLIVVAEHLFEDVRLVAHWNLDEAEGSTAHDNNGNHHANLNGNPVWQAAGGKIDGALLFDGTDDYVDAPFVWDAANGPCSTFAWIKGGAPGQAVISQTDGTGFGGTWLGLDPSDGKLFTTLMFVELKSESAIADDDWHHLGLVWDGSYRYLYMDGAEIAKDATALSYALSCNGGLNIGADKDLSTGSFFTGLIDDVRIYNQALNTEEIEALAR